MNLTTSNPTFDSNWKRFKGQYLATACGLALATVSVVAISNSKSDDMIASGPIRNSEPVAVRNIDNSIHHLIIVGSQDEASLLQTLIDEDGAIRSGTATYTVVAATSDDEERDILATHEDSNYQFQNLRSPLTPVTSAPADQPQFGVAVDAGQAALSQAPVRNESIDDYTARERAQIDLISRPATVQQQFGSGADAESAAQTLQHDIMASVVSTENATYGLGAPPVLQRQVSDADNAASVLSTELANFDNVDQARQGTVATAVSAQYVQYITLLEQVLVALSGAAIDAE